MFIAQNMNSFSYSSGKPDFLLVFSQFPSDTNTIRTITWIFGCVAWRYWIRFFKHGTCDSHAHTLYSCSLLYVWLQFHSSAQTCTSLFDTRGKSERCFTHKLSYNMVCKWSTRKSMQCALCFSPVKKTSRSSASRNARMQDARAHGGVVEYLENITLATQRKGQRTMLLYWGNIVGLLARHIFTLPSRYKKKHLITIMYLSFRAQVQDRWLLSKRQPTSPKRHNPPSPRVMWHIVWVSAFVWLCATGACVNAAQSPSTVTKCTALMCQTQKCTTSVCELQW